MSGRTWCGSCKLQAVAGLPVPTAGTTRCSEASQALILAILGIFVLGPLLEPLAIVRAVQARRRIARDTRLTGDARATVAIAIAIASLTIWGIVIGSQLIGAGRLP